MMSDDTLIESPRPSGGDVLRFAWDRDESPESLRARLAAASSEQWLELAAWILREARVNEVWEFLHPQDVAACFRALEPRLGRRRDFWSYLITTWRELGRL